MFHFYLDKSRLHLTIECSDKFFKLVTRNKVYEDRSVIVNVIRPKDNRMVMTVTAWAGKVGDKETLIFRQTVPYCDKQRFDINYRFTDSDEVIDFSVLEDENRVEWSTDNYKCVRHYNPLYAKKRYKYLRKNKLISKTFWSKYDYDYDILCEGCHVDKSSYKALSTPMDGRVIPLSEDRVKYHPQKFIMWYDNKPYLKIPSNLWSLPTFWNKQELKELAVEYEPKGEYKTWEKLSEYESKSSCSSRKDFPDFETAWEKCGKYWTDGKGNYKNFKGHSPTIGLWERVVSPNYLEWLDEYDFKRLWEIELTQEEIDGHGNIVGGAYRSISRKDEYIIYSKENYKTCNKSDMEKVVTMGWHSTSYPHSIACPVCKEIHKICKASDCWLPPWYKIRVRIGYWQSGAKLKSENLKYSIQKRIVQKKKG